jgi:rhamnosyltransferase
MKAPRLLAPGETLCGVVVTYHPAAETFPKLEAMARECGRVIAVDNGSPPEALGRIGAVPGVELLALGRNAGLAAALNRGAERALALGCRWIVTFDQDSLPAPGMVAALWERHRRVPAAAVIGAWIEEEGIEGSSYRWVRRRARFPRLFERAREDPALEDVALVITSGALTDLAVWNAVGRFDEALFIDYVDIDYCLRVVRAGRRVAVAPEAGLRHALGNRRSTARLGHDFRPMHHAPFRHYYIARNRVHVWRRHALAAPHWAAFDLSFAAYNLFRVLLFEDRRWAKLKAMTRGTLHGLLGRTGPMP